MRNRFGFVTLTFAVVLGLVSCSKEGEADSKENNDLIGVWKEKEKIALNAAGEIVEVVSQGNGNCPANTLSFIGGGLLTEIEYQATANCKANTTEGMWRVSGTKLLISDNGPEEDNEEVYTIEELHKTVLKLDIPISRDDLEDYEAGATTLRLVYGR